MTRSVFTARHDHLCQLLAGARRGRGLTQLELARRLRRPQSFVSKFENGERRLDVIEFVEVARAIGADPYAILRKVERG